MGEKEASYLPNIRHLTSCSIVRMVETIVRMFRTTELLRVPMLGSSCPLYRNRLERNRGRGRHRRIQRHRSSRREITQNDGRTWREFSAGFDTALNLAKG